MSILQQDATLSEWNRSLEMSFRRVELIGELEIDRADLDRIVERLNAQLKRLEPDEFVEAMVASAPALLATYMVLVGVHRYAEGKFWDVVHADLPGLPATADGKWRRGFLKALRRYGLPSFSHMDGLAYIGPILAHGGIPASYLPSFFSSLLWPAATDARWVGMSAQEVLSEWQATPWALAGVQVPIQRFLRFGGRVAESFVGRCLRMAEHRAAGDAVAESAQWGLPQHVVTAFEAFMRSPEALSRRASVAPFPKYRRPQIGLDLHGAGMVMALPAQVLSPSTSLDGAYWHIEVDGVAQRLPVRVEGAGEVARTEEATYCFQAPPGRCRAKLMVDNAPAREWDWQFAASPFPYFAFQAGTGRLVERALLPAEPLWLLAPRGASLSGMRVAETAYQALAPRAGLDDLALGWGAFEARLFAVGRYHKLQLALAERMHTLPVDDAGEPTARLVGQALVEPSVYAEAPALALSLEASIAARGSAWALTASPVGAAYPAEERELSLSAYFADAPADGEVSVPLRHLFGEGACGSFRVTLQGPQGPATSFVVTLAPGVAIETEESGRAVRLTLPPGARLVAGVAEGLGESEYRLTPAPGQRAVPVALELPTPGGGSVELALELSPHPLRWALVGLEASHSRVSFEARALSVSLPLLEQAIAPALLVELPRAGGGAVAAELRLLEPSGTVCQILQPDVWRESPNEPLRRIRFRLGLLKSSVRASQASSLRLVVRFQEATGRWREAPVATVTQDWAPRGIQAQVADGVLDLRWEERLALSDRHVWLWDLWRPWNAPASLDIPDAARGAASLALPAGHLPGAYRVQLGLCDPWNPVEPKKPEREAPGTCELLSGAEEARAERLEALDSAPLARAEKFLAASYSGVSQFPQMYYMEAEVQPEHLGPLFLTLLDSVEASRASRQAWTESLQRIFCTYRATDTQRMLAALRHGATRRELERALVTLLGLGWMRSVGPSWRPSAFSMPEGGKATAYSPALGDETREALWDIWAPLGLGAEPWPPGPSSIERLMRAFGEPALAVVRPWRVGARVTHRGRQAVIQSIGWDEGREEDAAALWRQAPPVGAVLGLAGGETIVVDTDTAASVALLSEVPASLIESPEPDVSAYLGMPDAVYEDLLGGPWMLSAGLLDAGGGQLAQAAWLRTMAKDSSRQQEAAAWCEAHVHTLLAAMDALRASAPHLAPVLEALSRRPHVVLRPGHPGYALATMPFLTGAIALANRALARGTVRNLGRLLPRDLDQFTVQAYGFASERLQRDFCLADLLLGLFSSPDARKETR